MFSKRNSSQIAGFWECHSYSLFEEKIEDVLPIIDHYIRYSVSPVFCSIDIQRPQNRLFVGNKISGRLFSIEFTVDNLEEISFYPRLMNFMNTMTIRDLGKVSHINEVKRGKFYPQWRTGITFDNPWSPTDYYDGYPADYILMDIVGWLEGVSCNKSELAETVKGSHNKSNLFENFKNEIQKRSISSEEKLYWQNLWVENVLGRELGLFEEFFGEESKLPAWEEAQISAWASNLFRTWYERVLTGDVKAPINGAFT